MGRRTRFRRAALAGGVLAALGLQAVAGQPESTVSRQAILAAEDARAPSDDDRRALLQAARSAHDDTRTVAVRALGRVERPTLLDSLVPALRDTAPVVRAQAANAVAQVVSTASGDASRDAARALRDRLKLEPHPVVRGILAAALGRLPYSRTRDAESAEDALLAASYGGGPRVVAAPADDRTALGAPVIGVTLGLGEKRDAPLSVLVGVAQGFESLVRVNAKVYSPSTKAVQRLRQLAVARSDAETPVPTDVTGFAEVDASAAQAGDRLRRLAMQALVTAKAMDDDTITAALQDPDAQVRRLAVLGAQAASANLLPGHLLRSVRDGSPIVRLEAVRLYGRTLRQVRGCAVLVDALEDLDPHVRLEAIDQLGAGCPEPGGAAAVLEPLVGSIAVVAEQYWHASAHALVSLARVAPDRAAARLSAFVRHPVWQVRMYAARAAVSLADAPTLERLTEDSHPNVREAALGGLVTLKGHEADAFYLAALSSQDYQLVRTAARALRGSPARESATVPLLAALRRLSVDARDTSRDPRLAILETLRDLAGASAAPALWSYLADFDPRISSFVADTLTEWTGIPHAALTTRFARQPAPRWSDASAYEGARARFLMRGGGTFELQLFPSEAPATVLRFVRLARAGYYDGLTFHRVVPNFVIQGGSPGANEYVGDGAYMRDEVGLRPHLRGSVGISTRGRDTGDAQIFIDLVDIPRLDHAFTVFASVARGMDAVDAVLEGAVIERVEIVE